MYRGLRVEPVHGRFLQMPVKTLLRAVSPRFFKQEPCSGPSAHELTGFYGAE